MLRIAICDDEKAELEKTSSMLSDYSNVNTDHQFAITYFESGVDLIDEIDRGYDADIYILDILMPDMSGIEVGSALRNKGRKGQIIYLTSSRDYGIESYETDALHYLLKPVTKAQLDAVLDKAIKRISSYRKSIFMVNTQAGIYRVNLDNLLYADQSERAMHFYLKNGDVITSCILREPFANAVRPLLEDSRFMLCGSSFALNLQEIVQIHKEEVLFSTGIKIKLPKTLQKNAKQQWMQYWLMPSGKEDQRA